MVRSMLKVGAVAILATGFASAAQAGISLVGLSVTVPNSFTISSVALTPVGPPWIDNFNGTPTAFTVVTDTASGASGTSAPVPLSTNINGNGRNPFALDAAGADTTDSRYEFVLSFSDGNSIDAFLQAPASVGVLAQTNPTQFVAAPGSSLTFTDAANITVSLGGGPTGGAWFPDTANSQQVGSFNLIVTSPVGVAEPATFAVLAAGLVGVACVRRRTRSGAHA